MTHIARTFTQISPIESGELSQPRGQIQKFFDHQVLVLLGEPGLGKTTSFHHAAKLEANAEFVRLGEFLSAADLKRFEGKTLYLDGLDEHRSRSHGVDVMDAINGRLKQLNCPKVRVSCRTAEWHGGKDVEALRAISKGTQIVQIDLDPLTDSDIRTLLADGDDFVDGAKEHGLHEFLKNPQDFLLLHDFYSERERWPANRSELMDGACRALLREPNPAHSAAFDDEVSDRELMRASDYLAAILMLSNVTGIAADRNSGSKTFPCIHELSGDLKAMRSAIGRHVFKPIKEKRIEPKHRMVAEYMAARYLAARVREGLSLRRIMALMTGFDGGIAPDLRGVYAWLITMLSGMAEHVLRHDPYGAIIYGDAYSWTPATKRSALRALRLLSEKDPWFRGQDWSRAALGGISEAALEIDFKEIIEGDDVSSHLVGAVLDMIAGGQELPGLGETLLKFARDAMKPDHFRSEAIEAFVSACPNLLQDLLELLEDVHSGLVRDENDYLRGTLLRYLYPDTVTPAEIAKFLVEPSEGIIGWYHMFVRYKLFERTDVHGLREIAVSIRDGDGEIVSCNGFAGRSFTLTLVAKLVTGLGEQVSAREVLGWLSLLPRYQGFGGAGDSEHETLRSFLREHDQLYVDLFLEHFEKTWPEEREWYQIWWPFRDMVMNVWPPHEFPRALIDRLRLESDSHKAAVLFEGACESFMGSEPGLSSITIEDLQSIASDRVEFGEILSRASICDVAEWRIQDARRAKQLQEERETRQARNVDSFAPHKASIETGEALGILIRCAEIWFDLFTDVDHDTEPRARLVKEIGEDLTKSVENGFAAVLDRADLDSVADIAGLHAEGKVYRRGYVILAAVDVLSKQGPDTLLNLPVSKLRVAVAYSIANSVRSDIEWTDRIRQEAPQIYTDVLNEYWRAQLALGAESLTNFYEFGDDEPDLPFMRTVVLDLLRDFPEVHTRVLKSMLINAIRYCPIEDVLSAVRSYHSVGLSDDDGRSALWLASGFALSPPEFEQRLVERLVQFKQDKWPARDIIMSDIRSFNDKGQPKWSVEHRKLVVRALGRFFSNVRRDTGGRARWVGRQDEPSAADDIRRMIHSFSTDGSELSAKSLSELLNTSDLTEWKSDLLYAIANQIRTAREARFTYASVDQVVATLSNEEPANVTDLKALVGDALNEVSEEIRHGNTDAYKAFWNTTRYGKVSTTHADENTARDRLLDLLRPKLRHLEVVAEPEVSYADGKRADIAIYSRGMKLPIEIKRDDHQEIWRAAEKQLQTQYTRDPAAEGNGIYLAFWFGGNGMRTPPPGIRKPTTAEELRSALEMTVPESTAGLIDVLVVDVSPPAKMQSKTKAKKKIRKKVKKKTKKKGKKKGKKKAKKKAKRRTKKLTKKDR